MFINMTGKWVSWRRKGLQEIERRHWAACLPSWFPLCLFCYSVYYRRTGFSSSGDLSARQIEFFVLFVLMQTSYLCFPLFADFVWDFIHHKPGNCLINLCKD